MSNPNAPFADVLDSIRQPEKLEHAAVSSYLVDYRTVALHRAMPGYTLVSSDWAIVGEFPTVQDAEFEVDALRIAGGPTMRVRWRALVSSDRFA